MKAFLSRLFLASTLLFPALAQAVYSDNAGRMATATGGQTASYTYYADQLRASKTVNGVVTRYHYGPGGRLLAETNGTTGAVLREYIWDDEVPVAQASNGPIGYLHTDHLSTPRLGTNSAGAQVWRWDSDAFGTTAPTGAATVNLRFPGQYFDAETGLHYNWHRTYDPASGRYVESDPIGLKGGLNTYSYAFNNAVGYTDHDGRLPILVPLLGFGLAAVDLATSDMPVIGGGAAKAGVAACEAGATALKRGVVEFQGLEVRAVRELSHLSDGTLSAMQKYGFADKDVKGNQLILHHHKQNPAGPIIEIPRNNHSIGNPRQHPNGNVKGTGLTQTERAQFNQWRVDYWKWRASEELKKRGQQ